MASFQALDWGMRDMQTASRNRDLHQPAQRPISGQRQRGRVTQQRLEAHQVPGLAEIIRLFMQLPPGLFEQRGKIDSGRQQMRHAQQGRDVGDIAVDTVSYMWILNLDGETAAIRSDA